MFDGDVFPARRAHDEKPLDPDAVFGGKALGHARRRILSIERRGLGRPINLTLDVLLLEPNARASGHEPPRSAKRKCLSAIRQFFERQIFVKNYLKFLGRSRDHAGRYLFASHFQE